MPTISRLRVTDIRFPTSWEQHGSDAMNKDPDYSAAYVTLETDGPHVGHGLVFTLGRGTHLCVNAIEALAARVEHQSLESITTNFAQFWRELTTGDSQLRWLGPEKGTVHMAAGAIINAIWDLWAKTEQKPLWQLLCELSPEKLVSTIDFRYLTDAITPDEAREILEQLAPTRTDRIQQLKEDGYPAYTTSTGWLGYSDERLRHLCQAALADGWTSFKIKVGGDLQQDLHRLRIVREEIGDDHTLMLDANQIWDVNEAIEWMGELAQFNPTWIEEPTSPDDVVGHQRIAEAIQPIGVATGEMGQNRVLFKQLLQLQAIQFCQIDSCRLAGVNEVLSVMLMAAKFGVPVCPHGGGVGLCEHIQHLAIFDYVAVSGSLENHWTEYVNHLHEHFQDPVVIENGRYRVPTSPGYSLDLLPESISQYEYPDGSIWREHLQRPG
ncbi:MAG: fuconate dehydratase [Planctomycetaceae bacterium]|nr:fuconate dehydratase [Planctomycetaceae bacterium]